MNDDKAHTMNEAAGGASGLSAGLDRVISEQVEAAKKHMANSKKYSRKIDALQKGSDKNIQLVKALLIKSRKQLNNLRRLSANLLSLRS